MCLTKFLIVFGYVSCFLAWLFVIICGDNITFLGALFSLGLAIFFPMCFHGFCKPELDYYKWKKEHPNLVRLAEEAEKQRADEEEKRLREKLLKDSDE